jgi:hypothetical protein
MRIDHVFLTKGLETVAVRSPYGALARAASDHLPLVVDLEISPAGDPADRRQVIVHQTVQLALEAPAAAPGPPGVGRRDGVAQAPVGDELLHAGQGLDRHRRQPARLAALAIQLVDRRRQAAQAVVGLEHVLGLVIEEVADQPTHEGADRRPAGLVGPLEGDVAFGVQPDRAVVEIGRAEPQHAVVHDRHLGVDDDRRPLGVRALKAEKRPWTSISRRRLIAEVRALSMVIWSK